MEIVISIAILAVVGVLIVLFLRGDVHREGRKVDEVYGWRDHGFERPRDK